MPVGAFPLVFQGVLSGLVALNRTFVNQSNQSNPVELHNFIALTFLRVPL